MKSNALELSKIKDPYNCSIEELEKEINRLKKVKEEYHNSEQAIKVFINSCYGAMASPFFVGYNVHAAEAVTLQGQDLIKFANHVFDEYFLNYWHKDTETHKKMGLTYVNPINNETTIVYNDTDSVAHDTMINTEKENKTIEKWFNEYLNRAKKEKTRNNDFKEVVYNPSEKILNWREDKGLYYVKTNKIIRHKTPKEKWKLKTKSRKEVIITNDHSLIVFLEHNKKLEKTPSEIKNYDLVLTPDGIEEIESCEKIGNFEDEYVYDVEVDDESHTFIANDILVHNSNYVTFQPALNSCDWNGEPRDFILKLVEVKLNDYLKEKFDEYAEKFNTKNIQALELEKVSRTSLMVSKKKYILDLAWKEPGVYYKPQEKISPTGIEIVQGSTPAYVRQVLYEMLNLIFKENKSLTYKQIVDKLREYKEKYVLQNPDDISITKSIGDYEKYILEDKNELKIAMKCPINVKAAGIYNHLLLNSTYRNKYNLLNTGDKVKYYYAKGEYSVFGFIPGNHPYEIAPEIDYDRQFAKTIVEPLNRYINTMGFRSIPHNLVYSRPLF